MSWSTLELGSSLEVLIDNRGKNPPYATGGIPTVSGMTVGPGVLNLGAARCVSRETWQKWMPEPTKRNDVVLTSEAPLGRAALVPNDEPLVLAQRVFGLRGKAGILDSRFLYYAFQTVAVQADLQGRATGTTVLGIRQPALKKVRIPAPNYAVQQAIAEVLGALDDKIAANTKLAATVEALGSAKISALGINEEPENGSISLDSLFDINPRRSPESDTVTLIDMQALPTSSPLVDTWSEGPKKGGTRFMNGDTLLARITPCLENRKTGFVDFLRDGEVGVGSTEFIVVRSKSGLPLGLSYFVATSSRFRDFAIQNMVGTSGRQRVAASDIARFELNPINGSDLVEVGVWADTNLSWLGSLRNESKILAATRNTLLPQLMSGKLRVKEAEALVSAAV